MGGNNGKQIKGLTPEQIMQVRAGARGEKGMYAQILEYLLSETDEAAIDVLDNYPEFQGKNLASVALGFRGAAKKAKVDDEFIITQQGESLFILVKSRLDQEAAA